MTTQHNSIAMDAPMDVGINVTRTPGRSFGGWLQGSTRAYTIEPCSQTLSVKDLNRRRHTNRFV